MEKYLNKALVILLAALLFPLKFVAVLEPHQAAIFFLIFCAAPAAAGFIYGKRVGGEQ